MTRFFASCIGRSTGKEIRETTDEENGRERYYPLCPWQAEKVVLAHQHEDSKRRQACKKEHKQPCQSRELDEKCVSEPAIAQVPCIGTQNSLSGSQVIGMRSQMRNGIAPIGEPTNPMRTAAYVRHQP